MLRQILHTFETTPGPISLDALSAELGLERAALEGMLAELVRMGRLVRVSDPAAVSCAACGHQNGCPYILKTTGVTYALPNAQPTQRESCSLIVLQAS